MWAACCLRSLCSLPSLQCKLVYKTDSGGGLAGFATQNWVSRALPATGSRGVKNGRTMNLPPRQPLQSLPQLNSTFDKRVYAFIYRCPSLSNIHYYFPHKIFATFESSDSGGFSYTVSPKYVIML